jgi:hypothetical protein
VFPLQISNHPIHAQKLRRRLDHGQNNPIKAPANNGFKVPETEFRFERIDPNVPQINAGALQGRNDHLSGGNFFVIRDRVLQIEYYGIGSGVENLLDLAGMIARCEEKTTIRPHEFNPYSFGCNDIPLPQSILRYAVACGTV